MICEITFTEDYQRKTTFRTNNLVKSDHQTSDPPRYKTVRVMYHNSCQSQFHSAHSTQMSVANHIKRCRRLTHNQLPISLTFTSMLKHPLTHRCVYHN